LVPVGASTGGTGKLRELRIACGGIGGGIDAGRRGAAAAIGGASSARFVRACVSFILLLSMSIPSDPIDVSRASK